MCRQVRCRLFQDSGSRDPWALEHGKAARGALDGKSVVAASVVVIASQVPCGLNTEFRCPSIDGPRAIPREITTIAVLDVLGRILVLPAGLAFYELLSNNRSLRDTLRVRVSAP